MKTEDDITHSDSSQEIIPNASENSESAPQPTVTDGTIEPIQQDKKSPKWRRLPAKIRNIFRIPRTKKGKALAVVVALVVVVGAGVGGAFLITKKHKTVDAIARFTAEPNPFRVISTTPADKQQGVSISDKLTLKFSRPVGTDGTAGDFFFTPNIEGTYTKGADNTEIVFTPKKPFDQPANIALMIHGEFKSSDGAALGADYYMSFSTAVPENTVAFTSDNNYYATLSSVPENQKHTYTINAGAETLKNNAVNLYKSDAKTFLSSQTYQRVPYDHDPSIYYNKVISETVDTSGMKLLNTKKDFKNSESYDVQQGKGVFYIEAMSDGAQKGGTWLIVGDSGVLIRQDDQKLIAVAKDTQTGANKTGSITLYNLLGQVKTVATKTIDGITEFDTPLNDPQIDCAVAVIDGEEQVIPVYILNSLADTRVTADLSALKTIYATTDRPVYAPGETAKISGFARLDNDAQYTKAQAETIPLYIYANGKTIQTINAQVNANGILTANLSIGNAMVMNDFVSNVVTISSENGQVAAFTVINPTLQTKNYSTAARFDKTSYVANETPHLTVTVKKTDGTPASDQTAYVTWYTKNFSEINPDQNEVDNGILGSDFGSTTTDASNGYPLAAIVKLDANGTTTLDVPVSKLPAGSSQAVSTQVVIKDSISTVTSRSTAFTVIHQGDYYISFAPSKSVFDLGEARLVRAVVNTLDGKKVSGVTVGAELKASRWDTASQKNIDTTFGATTGTTDSNGMVELTITPHGARSDDSLTFTVTVADSHKNKVQADQGTYNADPAGLHVYSHAQLTDLDIKGLNGDLTVGNKKDITIVSPEDTSVLLTFERGRILHSELLDLRRGENTYTLDVSANLSPGFTMSFNYFKGGNYYSEGTPISVKDSSKLVNVTISADKAQYSPGSTANVIINTNADNKGVATRLLVTVVSNTIYSVSDLIGTDIQNYFYGEREITTNGSSSRTGIGYGGGRCGGGGFPDASAIPNSIGTTTFYKVDAVTDASGKTTLAVPFATAGSWRIIVRAASDATAVGSGYSIIDVK